MNTISLSSVGHCFCARARWLALAFGITLLMTRASAQTLTLTSSSNYLLSSGGQVNINVAFAYSTPPTALALRLVPPAGWTYVSTSGANVPAVSPIVGDAPTPGEGLGWFFLTIPTGGAQFTVTLNYPASTSAAQMLTGEGLWRAETGSEQKITVPALTFSPADPPVITTQPASQSVIFGSDVSFVVVATAAPAPTFKWQRSVDGGATWTDLADGGRVSGAATATLQIAGALLSDSGGYRVVVANSVGSVNSSAAPLTVLPAPQAISFGTLPVKTFGDASFSLTASTSSGLAVTFTSSSTAVATVNGTTVTIVGAGTTVITARQAGDANYASAEPVTQTLTVNKAEQAITFTLPATVSLAQSPITLNATASSGLTVSFASSDTTVGTISGNVLTLLRIPFTPLIITATQAGNSNFNAATPVSQQLVVVTGTQTLTFPPVPAKTYGAAPFTITASSNRGLLVTFVSSNPAVATVSTGTLDTTSGVTTATVTIVGAGTTTLTAQQAGNADFAAASDVPQTLTVNKATGTLMMGSAGQTYDGTPKGMTTTTVPPGLAVTCTYTAFGGTPTTTMPTNAGTYTVTCTINDPNYAGSATGTLTIAKASQVISFTLSAKGIGDPPFVLPPTTPDGLPITYTSSNPAVATVSGNVVTLVGAGSTVITAKQAGDANHLAAADVAQTLIVNPAAPVIVSTPPLTQTAVQGKNYVFGPITLGALSGPVIFSATGLPTGLSVNALTGNISGIPTSAPGAYTITLTATNAGGAASKTINLALQAPAPVITSPAAASAVVGTIYTSASPLYAVAATSGATVTVAGLPAGLSLDTTNPAAPKIIGTLAQPGVFTIPITASNATGSVILPLVITGTLPAGAPAYVGPLNPSGTAGVAFSFTPNFGSGTTTYALTSGALPAGLSFNTGTGAIAGTATQAGVFPVTLAATRAGITTTANLNLTINPAAAAPVVGFPSPGSVRTGTVGTAISSIQLTAAPAATSFAAGASLPPGLTMTSSGLISGTPTAIGYYTVPVTAANAAGAGPTALLQFTISPSAQAPVITSAPVALGRVGVNFSYALTASPAATTFVMTGTLPAGLFFGGGAGTVTGVPIETGTFVVWFAGSNASGTGSASAVTFTIMPPLVVPAVTSNGSAMARVGDPFSYVITATNVPTSFGATGLPAGLVLDSALGVISGIPALSSDGTPVSVTLTASNMDGTSAPKVLSLSIAAAAGTPVITSAPSAEARVGTSFSFQAAATESPSSFTAVGLPAGLLLNPASGLISGTPTQAGSFEVRLRAANVAGLGDSATLRISIGAAATAPVITSAAAVAGAVGLTFNYQTVAMGGATSFTVDGALPLGLTLNTITGVISGNPTTAGISTVTLTATGAGGTSLPQPLVIAINPANGVPVITSSATAIGTAGNPFFYTIAASNMPGAPFPSGISLDAVNLPPGLGVNPATGMIQGTPLVTGTFVVSLVGTNAAGSGAARNLTVTINPPLTAPVVTSPDRVYAQVGSNFGYQITASNNPTSFEVLGAPPWLVVNTVTGALAGTPTEPGTVTVQLIASNGAGAGRAVPLTLGVGAAAGTPVITSSRTAFGATGVASAVYQATASPAASAFFAAGLPPGLALNTTTGAITGTPTVSGTYPVTLWGTNASGAGASVALTLQIASTASFGAATLPAGQVGVSYSYQLATTPPASAGAIYTATGLPGGLAINASTGLISGTPATAGTSNVVLSVSSAGLVSVASAALTIGPSIGAPVITSAASASGAVGTAFSYFITATNSPTSFNIAGALPPGISVNGATLSGIPAAAGSYALTISANNATGTGAAAALTLTIAAAAAAPVITSSTSLSGAANTFLSFQVFASGSPSSFTASGLPLGLALDATSGLITGTPTIPGIYPVKVSATNASGTGGSVTLTFAIGTPPVITSSASASGRVGTAFQYTITASNNPASFNLSLLPPGLAINTATGVISGTPSSAGTFAIALSANNASGTGPVSTLALNVLPSLNVDFDKWVWRNPVPQGNALADVAWTGDKWVAVGAGGTIVTSSDGVTWSIRNSGTTAYLNGVASSGSQIVAVGEAGAVLTSVDGLTWSSRRAPTASTLRDIVWTGGQFVAVGDSGTIFTSGDGMVWSSRPSGTAASIYGVAASGSSLVAVDVSGNVVTSADGITWTSRASGATGLFAVAWSGGQFAAVGSGGAIVTSPDGVAWTARNSPTTNLLLGVAWCGSRFVAVGDSGSVVTSVDGLGWSQATSGVLVSLTGLAWNGTQAVAIGNGGTLLTSANGTTWTRRNTGPLASFLGAAWNGTQFAVVGSGGAIVTSNDGATWTSRTSGTSNPLYGVAANSSQFVAVGHGGVIRTSADGTSWTAPVSGTSTYLYGVRWCGTQFVAVGGGGRILTSSDGATWTSRTSGTAGDLYDVAWDGSQLIVVGADGKLLASADGVTWSSRSSATTNWLFGIAWNGSVYVAVGQYGAIVSSNDGVTWINRSYATGQYFSAVVWSGDQFVAIGSGGFNLASPDGVTWTPHSSGTRGTLRGAVWTGSQLLAVGHDGAILTASEPLVAGLPTILSQPQSQAVPAGSSITLSVTAIGTPAPTYQWRKSGGAIAGATAANYSLTGVQVGQAGSYDVVVTNSAGAVTSAVATIYVLVPPAFDGAIAVSRNFSFGTGPSPGPIIQGSSVVLPFSPTYRVVLTAPAMTGTAPIALAWRKAGATLGGATGSSFTIPNLTATEAGDYSLAAANVAGSAVSAIVTLTPPAYQWYKDGVALAGATTATLSLSSAQPAQAGSYTLRVTTPDGVLTSSPISIVVVLPPAIVTPPANQVVAVGQTATFTVVASGSTPLAYQWRKAGLNLAGATAATLTLANVQTTDAGSYDVVVSNAGGSVTSSAATLTVNAAPSIVTPPASKIAAVESGVTLTVVASGAGPLNYQWKKDGVALAGDTRITGATTATLSLANLALGDAGSYTVVVANAGGSVTSASATLTVVDARATHSVSGFGYSAGATVTISQTLTYSGPCTGIGWQMLLPNGWTYASGGGAEGEVKPEPGTTALLEWAWTTVPASPLTFTTTLNVPAGETGDRTIASLAIFRIVAGPASVLVKPDPLTISQITTHSGDTDRNFRFSLLELTRVIELYNTRNGSTRTGCYKVQEGSEDGFASDTARAGSAIVTLEKYHSGDSNRDGKLSLLELTRVIELYNYRTGSTRTGQYHVQTNPPTEDGFAPGP